MTATQITQRERLRHLLEQSLILRARELREAGVAAQAIARALDIGELNRIARGLYLPDFAQSAASRSHSETRGRQTTAGKAAE